MKILIIALPKSASTSLQKFLAQHLRLSNSNSIVRRAAFRHFCSELRFRDFFSKNNILAYWHSDFFYGSEAMLRGLVDVPEKSITKIHLMPVSSEDLEWLKSYFDHIIFLARDFDELSSSYGRGEITDVYPNLYGKKMPSDFKRMVEITLETMESFWSKKNLIQIDYADIICNKAYQLQSTFDIQNFVLPRERFSRNESHRTYKLSMKFILRKCAFFIENVLISLGINDLLIRRLCLAILKKY